MFLKNLTIRKVMYTIYNVVFAVILASISLNAMASGLQMSPLGLYFPSNTNVNSFTLDNFYSKKITISTYIAKLDVNTGRYSKTDDFIVFPPISTVAVNGHQVFRVALNKPRNPNVEGIYRFVVSEVPPELKDIKDIGINMVMSYDMPLFVTPLQEKFATKWSIKKVDANNRLKISMVNSGNIHCTVQKVALYEKNDKDRSNALFVSSSDNDKSNFINEVIYAGKSKEWTIKLDKQTKSNSLFLVVKTQKGEISEDIQIS